jgi:hypothetical protein
LADPTNTTTSAATHQTAVVGATTIVLAAKMARQRCE